MLTLFHQIFTPANTGFMLKGLGMTIVIAVLAILISIFFGTILALVRTYASDHFKWAASLVAVYTEFFRCTPNLLWILWIYFTVKGNKIAVSVKPGDHSDQRYFFPENGRCGRIYAQLRSCHGQYL